LGWQGIATAAIALGSWPFAGADGAFSAILGGLINLVAGFCYYLVASLGRIDSAGATISRLVRAEATKIMLVVAGLWIVLTAWKGVLFVPLFIAFAVTALLPGVAFLVREEVPPVRH